MPTRYIKRSTALDGGQVSRNNANAVFIDSDDDQLKFTTGASGTTTVDVVTETQTQTVTNKTIDLASNTLTMTSAQLATALTNETGTGLVVFNTNPVISHGAVAGGATLTLTAGTHAGRSILLDTAAGTTITLPAATGTGDRYEFLVTVTPTSNQHQVNVVGNDEYVGVLSVTQDSADTALHFDAADAADNDRINMNGTTTGGRIGDWIQLVDISTDNWHVRGVLSGSGIEATPFQTGQVT